MTEDEKNILTIYQQKVSELKKCELINHNIQLKYSLNVQKDKGMTSTTLPSEEHLRSFLLVLRNFYAPSEEIHFPKVCRILIKKLKNDDIRTKVEQIDAIYKQTLDNSSIQFIENNNLLTPNDILRRWLYGYYHHTDVKKRKKVQEWGFAVGLTKVQFISTILTLAKCVIWLNENVINQYLENEIQ